jgi:N-acetylglutamate synthase-like GNAT family acetyltransferase
MLEILPMPNDDLVIETVSRWNADFWKEQGAELSTQIKHYKELLSSDDNVFALVAYYDGILAGSICLEKQNGIYLGAGLFVPKEMRKHRVGLSLIEAMKSHAAKLGVDKIYVWTPNLTRLYTYYGWVVIQEKTEHLGMLVDILVLNIKGE